MPKFLWTQKAAFGPRPRSGHAMAYDSKRQRTVLFGGDAAAAGLFGDTWEWDGENWTQITDLGPSPRSEFGMAYDNLRGKTVLFGGRTDRLLNDTWEWDGENWTQVEDSGPAPRSELALAFDPQRGQVVLCCGAGSLAPLADTWAWDGEAWTQAGEAGPPARMAHGLAYDPGRKALVLFGGWDSLTLFNDTWSWDGATWTQVADLGPSPRRSTALVTVENQLALFGGQLSAAPNGQQGEGDSWEWVGKRWVQRADFGPAARWSHAMAYDGARRRLVLFGGHAIAEGAPGENPVGRFLGDTWEHAAAPGEGPVENGPAGMLADFTLTPDVAPLAQIANGDPFLIQGTIRLATVSNQPLQVVILADLPGPALEVLIPAGVDVFTTKIPVPREAPVGTFTYRVRQDNNEKTAKFTIT